MISSRVVVLPHPDSPTIEKHSPSRISKVTPLTAFTVPTRFLISEPFMSGKCFFTLRTSSTGARSSRGIPSNFDTGVSGIEYSSSAVLLIRSWDMLHDDRCPSPAPSSGISSGSPASSLQHWPPLLATGQRSRNEQRSTGLIRFGGVPSIGTSDIFCERSTRGTAPSRPMVYGWLGYLYRSSAFAISTGLPAYITRISSAIPATTPRSWVIIMVAAPVSSCALSITSSTCA